MSAGWKWKTHFKYVAILFLLWLIPAYRFAPLSPDILREIYRNRAVTGELAIFLARPIPYLVIYFFNPMVYLFLVTPLMPFVKTRRTFFNVQGLATLTWVIFLLLTFPFTKN